MRVFLLLALASYFTQAWCQIDQGDVIWFDFLMSSWPLSPVLALKEMGNQWIWGGWGGKLVLAVGNGEYEDRKAIFRCLDSLFFNLPFIITCPWLCFYVFHPVLAVSPTCTSDSTTMLIIKCSCSLSVGWHLGFWETKKGLRAVVHGDGRNRQVRAMDEIHFKEIGACAWGGIRA